MASTILRACDARFTLEGALAEPVNFLEKYESHRGTERFRTYLWDQRESIERQVRHDLGLRDLDHCEVIPENKWPRGGFNMCVLVRVVIGSLVSQVVFRCPMAHKHAETHLPGSLDEKVNAEVATYIYMQEHCKDVRIPQLHAFGFAHGERFVHISRQPFYVQVWHSIRKRFHQLLSRPLLSGYTSQCSDRVFAKPYMLLEYIPRETGEMLCNTWEDEDCRKDAGRQERLFKGIAGMMLSLARLPQTAIGSLRFDTNNGTISLSNRPLLCNMMLFENAGTPRAIQPHTLYADTGSFVADLLTLHDDRFRTNKHSPGREDYIQERMTIRVILRAIAHHFISANQSDGGFILQFTDLSASNILVDSEWNVVAIVDLEWILSLPRTAVSMPLWIARVPFEDVIDCPEFEHLQELFWEAVEAEEKSRPWTPQAVLLSSTMKASFHSKAMWFWRCLLDNNLWLFFVEDYLLPLYSPNREFVADLKGLAVLMTTNTDGFVKQKVEEEKEYQRKVRGLFQEKKKKKSKKDGADGSLALEQ